MALNIEKSELDESIGSLTKAVNEDVLDQFAGLAVLLKEERENAGNAVVDQAFDACIKFQNIYNGAVESLQSGFLKDATEIAEIAEYLEKQANMGDVGSHDATFSGQAINAEDVRI